MKCAVCGKEFGNGSNCKNCGTDRVTGLANYSGYDNHARSSNHHYTDNAEQTSNNITACHVCGEIIPSNSHFCPVCGTELFVKCPNCGNEYSTQYSICNHCGTNRKQFLEEQGKREAEREARLKKSQEEKRKQEAKGTPAYIIVLRIIGFMIIISSLCNYSNTTELLLGILAGILLLFSSEKWLEAL